MDKILLTPIYGRAAEGDAGPGPCSGRRPPRPTPAASTSGTTRRWASRAGRPGRRHPGRPGFQSGARCFGAAWAAGPRPRPAGSSHADAEACPGGSAPAPPSRVFPRRRAGLPGRQACPGDSASAPPGKGFQRRRQGSGPAQPGLPTPTPRLARGAALRPRPPRSSSAGGKACPGGRARPRPARASSAGGQACPGASASGPPDRGFRPPCTDGHGLRPRTAAPTRRTSGHPRAGHPAPAGAPGSRRPWGHMRETLRS
ncbi:hypothetical protein RKD22_004322 [Streptomyces pristinaespiralis]